MFLSYVDNRRNRIKLAYLVLASLKALRLSHLEKLNSQASVLFALLGLRR